MRECIDYSICSLLLIALKSVYSQKIIIIQAVHRDETNKQLSSHNDAVFSVGGALRLQHGFRQRFVSYSMSA